MGFKENLEASFKGADKLGSDLIKDGKNLGKKKNKRKGK
jgi:hypothetical protein